MSLLLNYKNVVSNKNAANIIYLVDEKFNILSLKTLGKKLNKREYNINNIEPYSPKSIIKRTEDISRSYTAYIDNEKILTNANGMILRGYSIICSK